MGISSTGGAWDGVGSGVNRLRATFRPCGTSTPSPESPKFGAKTGTTRTGFGGTTGGGCGLDRGVSPRGPPVPPGCVVIPPGCAARHRALGSGPFGVKRDGSPSAVRSRRRDGRGRGDCGTGGVVRLLAWLRVRGIRQTIGLGLL